jgi:hypothetical protein
MADVVAHNQVQVRGAWGVGDVMISRNHLRAFSRSSLLPGLDRRALTVPTALT